MAESLIALFVALVFALIIILRIKAIDSKCTGDCNQGRNCTCINKE